MLCAPAVIIMIAVTLYPIGYSIYLSLQRYDLRFPDQAKFIGLENYVSVLTSPYWWIAFWNTVIITVVSVAIELVLGMALAIVMHRTIFGRGAVRTSILIPYGIVTVVAAFSWQFAWTPSTGYLSAVFGDAAPLTSKWPAIAVIILAEVWKTTPFMALLLMAGLALVPEDLQKAAKVDGASAWQRFVRVTLPLMKPAILVARCSDARRSGYSEHLHPHQRQPDTGSVSILGYDNLLPRSTSASDVPSGADLHLRRDHRLPVHQGFGAAAPGRTEELMATTTSRRSDGAPPTSS
jgi:multiple sugar transport system permease protein